MKKTLMITMLAMTIAPSFAKAEGSLERSISRAGGSAIGGCIGGYIAGSIVGSMAGIRKLDRYGCAAGAGLGVAASLIDSANAAEVAPSEQDVQQMAEPEAPPVSE